MLSLVMYDCLKKRKVFLYEQRIRFQKVKMATPELRLNFFQVDIHK